MTCVQGMVVRREREIREFVKTPFYRVFSSMAIEGTGIESEWKAVEGSKFYQSPKLYKDNGFLQKEDAGAFIAGLTGNTEFTENENGQSSQQTEGTQAVVEKIEKKKEQKKPPLLYNLAELQNDCSKFFKISPDETLRIVQEL